MFLKRNLRIGIRRDAVFIAALCSAALLAFYAYVARLSDVTHDAFHEMSLVREYITSGVFPMGDVFAFTPTVYPVVHHEWGTGLVLYFAAGCSPLGLDGMAILRSLVILAIALALYRVARNNGAHPLMIAVCAPILFPLLWVGFATVRAQIFTLLFMLLQMLLQQSDWRGSRKWVIAWFGLYVVWLNMHAGFVVGLAMLFLHIVERWFLAIYADRSWEGVQKAYFQLWHHLALIPLICFGILLNPWGTAYAPYLYRAITMPRPTMLEWQPLWMTHDSTTAMAAFALSLITLGYVAKNRRFHRLRGWLFCCLAAYMALKHIRHGSLYSIVWMALVPGWLTPTVFGRCCIEFLTHWRQTAMRFSMAVAVVCASFVCFHPLWKATLPSQDPGSAMVYPVGAVQFLKLQDFHGNVLTPFASGAYVSWMCYPQIRVSIDGRYEVAYRDDVLPKHDLFYSAKPSWESVLSEFKADAILIQVSSPAYPLLGTPGTKTETWKRIYEDQTFALFARSPVDEVRVGNFVHLQADDNP